MSLRRGATGQTLQKIPLLPEVPPYPYRSARCCEANAVPEMGPSDAMCHSTNLSRAAVIATTSRRSYPSWNHPAHPVAASQ